MEPTLRDIPSRPEAPPPPRSRRSAARLSAVSDEVRNFLTQELQAQEVRLTRITPRPGGEAGWEAHAEILVPDLAIKTLGLPLTQQVLERRGYAVQLDPSLVVIGYESLDEDG
jgi:hypothetical protein